MTYVDGFLIAIPKKNLPKYRKQASVAGKVWMEHGALEYFECVADELEVPDDKGKLFSPFPALTKLKKTETLVFSWIAYRSKAHRNAVNKKVMADPRIVKSMQGPMPFDMARLNVAGFKAIVEKHAKAGGPRRRAAAAPKEA